MNEIKKKPLVGSRESFSSWFGLPIYIDAVRFENKEVRYLNKMLVVMSTFKLLWLRYLPLFANITTNDKWKTIKIS